MVSAWRITKGEWLCRAHSIGGATMVCESVRHHLYDADRLVKAVIMTLVASLLFVYGCRMQSSSAVLSDRFRGQIGAATKVHCTFKGMNGYDEGAATTSDKVTVQRIVDEVTRSRRWTTFPGPVSESREVRIEFYEGEGDLLGSCVVIGPSLLVVEQDGIIWQAKWPGARRWLIDVTHAETAKE